jgi:pseudaminic acid cytidylyltransferase
MNIAIIPARGGSKRIPHKNIKVFCGKPMIAHAINVAKKSGLFDHIIVSTDDEEIALIGSKYGAEIPFMRPVNLADDYTTTSPVIIHAIETCKELGWNFNNVCCLYPSVPFLQSEDLINSLNRFIESKADYCFSVTEYPSAIQRALRILNDGKMMPFSPEFEKIRTQDLEPAYYDAGQFYWGKSQTWQKNSNIHSNSLGYIIPSWRVIDIDTPDDWKRAEIFALDILNRKN